MIHFSASVDAVLNIEEINLELGLVDLAQVNLERRSLKEKVVSKMQTRFTNHAHWINWSKIQIKDGLLVL